MRQTSHGESGFCATCGVPFDAEQPVAVSGGISGQLCAQCRRTLTNKKGKQLQSFIDIYENPLLIINTKRRIIAANLAAMQALSQDMSKIINSLAGDVISCENARLPGGCGRTQNCRACVINNSVSTTLSGPVEVTGAPAHQTIVRDGEHAQQTFLISTQRVGDRIMVQVV